MRTLTPASFNLLLLLPLLLLSGEEYSVWGGAGQLIQRGAESRVSGATASLFLDHTHPRYFDSFSFTYGNLFGYDPYEEKLHLHSFDGDTTVALAAPTPYATPFIGLGFRILWYRYLSPAPFDQTLFLLYIPLGFKTSWRLHPKVELKSHIEMDLYAFGRWVFKHPVIPNEFHKMDPSPGFKALLTVSIAICGTLRGEISPYFRYTPLSFGDEVPYAPFSVSQFLFGAVAGVNTPF